MSSIDQLKSLASSKLGFARTNQFLVELPTNFSGSGGFLGSLTTLLTSGVGLGSGGGDLNLLCSSATLPGKQILTHDRRIGMEFQKVAYGYAVDDVALTFYALNDYGTRKYFDEWRSYTLNENGHIAGYKKDYAKAGFKLQYEGEKQDYYLSRKSLIYGMILTTLVFYPFSIDLGNNTPGAFYFLSACLLSVVLLIKCIKFYTNSKKNKSARSLFIVTIIYLPLLLTTMVIDHYI